MKRGGDVSVKFAPLIIAKAGQEAYLTAVRFVQRNIIHQEISRYIPQYMKITVASRNQERYTQIDQAASEQSVR